MERAELAHFLKAPTSSANADRFIAEAEPMRFMDAFSQAAGGSGNVFLCDPSWNENERIQLASLAQSAIRNP
ncbi:MAG: hypothetical protein KGJ37_07640, partial [Verrucomicrobiota bacterium]|nr:hypothetical protein [Verrucomicrobiota bacterium]